jgi:anti-sigma B factor antagonist
MDVTIAGAPVGGVTVVALRGELDVDTAPRLRSVLSSLVSSSVCQIVIDLSAVSFCDSIGLSAFVDAHHRCTTAGGYLRLVAVPPYLLRVLSVVGLLGRLAVYDTVNAACLGGPTAGSTSAPKLDSSPAGPQPRRPGSPAP